MPCNPLTNLTGCLGGPAGGHAATAAATAGGGASGWNAICQSFAKAAQQLLGSFARSFTSIPPVNLSYAGVRSVYGLSLEIAAAIAALLLMIQVIRTVLAHDSSAIAQGLTGVGKAALAFVLTLGAAATALRASDEVTSWIIARTFGSPQALSHRLAGLVSFNPKVSASLLLILALLGILLTLALWAQLLVRNVAVTVLVAVSPVAAAGQVAHASQQWWRKLLRATIGLIVLKPAVALIFVVGLNLPGTSGAVEKPLAGMLVLLLAGIAWPVMTRAAAVAEVYVTGGALAGGRGAGRAAAVAPGGVDPTEFSRVAEARTMAAVHELRTRYVQAGREAAPGGQPSSPGPAMAGIGLDRPAAALKTQAGQASWPGPGDQARGAADTARAPVLTRPEPGPASASVPGENR